MCGRYTFTNPRMALARLEVQRQLDTQLSPRFNVTPAQRVPVVVADDGTRSVRLMRWGYRPRWITSPKAPAPINARAETLREKPLYRGALASGRCVIPADGYYEWHAEAGRK